MRALTSERCVTEECLAPGLAAMDIRVEEPVLSNCKGEPAAWVPDESWQVGAEANLDLFCETLF